MRIGIDIGGMTIKIGLVDDAYKIVARKVIPTNADTEDAKKTVRRMAEALKELLKEYGIKDKDCASLGIACPGTVDGTSGTVVYSNNIHWEDVPIVAWLREHISLPVYLANDADAAALAETLAGAAKGRKNAVLVTLGTGVGGGVIIDGHIFTGPLRGGCELGHMVIERNGRPCTCGRCGCFETYASASALMQDAKRAAEEHPESLMNELVDGDRASIDGRIIFDAEKKGDPTAKEVVLQYEKDLSVGLANIINIFRPEAVILGGGVSAQKEYLTKPLSEMVKKECFGGSLGEIAPIVTSQLENDAGIIGAAYLGKSWEI